MINWKERCTIGITTRDRAEDLRHTIEKQKAIGLGDMRYIIVDDGSADAEVFRTIAAQLPCCRFVRHEQSAGYIKSRNEMAEMCETEFLISLDDDSYFENLTGMAKAFGELQSEPRLALLSFCVIQLKPHERRRTQFPAGELWWFRGCGYLLRVSAFLDVGGYPKEFQYGGEETHLTMQFFRAGYKMLHCPEVVVEHRWSPNARDYRKWAFNFSQSSALLKIYNLPWLPMFAGLAKLTFWDLLWASWEWQYPLARYMGAISGIWLGLRQRSRFRPLSWSQYAAFRKEQQHAHVPEQVEIERLYSGKPA